MFDVLTYVKGCAVLRMLEQYLGADTFRDGIRLYLERHAYANTVTSDLWSALEAASGEPVGAIMDTWILQGGYPLISVDGDVITQEPFSYAPTESPSNIGNTWKVPVLARSLDGGATTAHLLDGPSDTIALGHGGVVNAGGSGFYRTAYSFEHLAAIAARLDELDELERAVLFSDTWASILVGRSSFVDLFTLAEGLAGLDEPSTWDVVVKAVALVNRIVDEPGRVLLAGVVHRLFGPVFARLGWEPVEGETTQAGELRATAINVLGTIGRDESIMAEAAQRFDAGSLGGDLADAIVAITMHQHRPGDVAVCEERRKSAPTPQDEQRYLYAPAGTDDVDVAMEVLERAFRDVRTQDAPYLIGVLVRNRVAGPVVWKAMSDSVGRGGRALSDGLARRDGGGRRDLRVRPRVRAAGATIPRGESRPGGSAAGGPDTGPHGPQRVRRPAQRIHARGVAGNVSGLNALVVGSRHHRRASGFAHVVRHRCPLEWRGEVEHVVAVRST